MRFASENTRRRSIAGTRRRESFKSHDHGGAFLATPWKFARGYNLTSGAGTNKTRFYPAGLMMPLHMGEVPAANYPAAHAAAASWKMGDTFFRTVAFEYEDGSVSMYCIPRDKNATLANGLGLTVVNDTGAGQFYDFIPWRNIPCGPVGVVKRRLYRSPKKSKTEVAGGAWPDISDLQLCHIIENNTTTFYDDYNGNDGVLAPDQFLRLDQIWPPCGRYDWGFEERHGTGYLRPNPCSIVLAPIGSVANYDINGDEDTTPPAASFLYTVQNNNTLLLKKVVGGVTTNVGIGLTVGIQDVLDQINATTVASACGQWAAQAVPGSDIDAAPIGGRIPWAPTESAVTLCATIINTKTITTTDPSGFMYVPEGAKINGAGIAAGAFVVSKQSNTSLTMSVNATATGGPVTLLFYSDCGEGGAEIVTDGTFGNIRAYSNAYFGVIGFDRQYLDSFPVAKGDFCLTSAGPTGKPYQNNLFHTKPGGRHSAEAAAGIFMGAAPINGGFGGCVLFYSNWIGVCENRTQTSTAADADYHVRWIDKEHGCKSPYSIVHGNGWAGCWRDDGYWIFDGVSGKVISGDHYAVTTLGGVGEFAYEAALCNAAAASDTNDYYMHAHYRDGRLWINYRVSAGVFADACYDASTSIEGDGIAQMLDDQGQPFGWSPRCSYSWRSFAAGCGGAIGSVRKSDGLHLYQADDKNDKTNCGLLQEFESTGTYLDGADPVQWTFFGPCDMPGGLLKSAVADQVTFLYKNTVASGPTGVAVTIYRDQARTKSVTFALDLTTGSDFFSRKPKNPPIACRAPAEVCEMKITGGALAAERIFEVSGIKIPTNVLESVT
jgi:hypothetical protein